MAKPKPSNITSQIPRLLTKSGLPEYKIVKKGIPKPIETATDLTISFITLFFIRVILFCHSNRQAFFNKTTIIKMMLVEPI